MKKLLVIDFSEVFFTSVYAKERAEQNGTDLALEFFVLRKIFSYIKAFPKREVYLVCDGQATWRKEIMPEYKAHRKEQREKHEAIDWPDVFRRYGQMVSMIDIFTPLSTFREDTLEADDLISVLCKEGHDLIIFSSDKDLNQLTVFNNVKLVAPKSKKVKDKFVFKDIKNPIKELEKLVKGGDRCDNVPRATTEAQRILNNKVVNLIQLPDNVVDRAKQVLTQERCKTINIDAFCKVYPWGFVRKELEALIAGGAS